MRVINEKMGVDEITISKLMSKARKAINFSYAPYSNFRVGAAVLGENGKIYSGCNIENSSYGLSICAERVAIFNAISKGIKKIKVVAIYCEQEVLCSPCGACRQVIYEFAKNAIFVIGNNDKEYVMKTVAEMLPLGFHLRK